jgi:hypothetical protein
VTRALVLLQLAIIAACVVAGLAVWLIGVVGAGVYASTWF